MNREPLIRVTKRDGMPLYKNILIRACSIVMAMLLVVFFVHLTAKISAGETLSYMWEGVFGNSIYMRDTVFYAAKLLCIAVALAPAFKMRFWKCTSATFVSYYGDFCDCTCRGMGNPAGDI